MSAQLENQGNYLPSMSETVGHKVSDVEQELAVLNKNAEALDLCVGELEKRLSCVLPPVTPAGPSQATSQPRPVRVPLAEMLEIPNHRLHAALTPLNDIIARIELPS